MAEASAEDVLSASARSDDMWAQLMASGRLDETYPEAYPEEEGS